MLEFVNNKLYAATNNGLQISTNLGKNWYTLNNDSKSINDIVIDDDKVCITTNSGNYIATENEKIWYALCEGMGKQATNRLIIKDDILYAGTSITSVWKRAKVVGNLPPSENSATIGVEKLKLCPTGGSVNLFSKIGISPNSSGTWSPSLSGYF